MANTATFTGASRREYEFYVFQDGTDFNDVSGVYVFCRLTIFGSWEALYVGEAQSLKQRLNAGIGGHDGYKRAKSRGMTHIAAIAVSGDAERLRVETDLRHGLNPSCNAQGVNALGRYLFQP